jgi:4-hydroxybenzoate polyprenyltransferase
MKSFFKLVRIQNLLIIAFTQYMVRWFLIYPILCSVNFTLQLSEFHFFLLALSTVLIAAAGYAINDYFDVKIDRVNKPQQLVIGKGIKRRVAMGAHTVMNVLAILLAFYVSYSIGIWKLTLVHVMAAAGLWFYSTTFKRQFLIGNVLIAVFTAFIPVLVATYELIPCYQVYFNFNPDPVFHRIWNHVFALSFFAFITTLVREIIKDMEDVEGDKEYGCETLPIVLGKNMAKVVAVVLSLITMACLFYLQLVQWKLDDMYSFYYFSFAIQLPFIVLIYKIVTAEAQQQFRIASHINKFIMLMGICYLFVFSYLLFEYLHAVS